MNSQELNRKSPPASRRAHSRPVSPAEANVDEKLREAQCIETTEPRHTGVYVSPEEIQGRFPLLRDLGQEQMDALNKRVVKKIDWRLMPIVSLMYLMK